MHAYRLHAGRLVAMLLASATITVASAEPAGSRQWAFDGLSPGSTSSDFEYVVTAKKAPGNWIIAMDGDNLVLAEVDRDQTERRFAMALAKGALYKDLVVSVRAKPVAGDVEKAAGLVWRYQDPDNYYVARFNSDSIRVDRVVGGERLLLTPGEIKSALAEDEWHTLTVEHRGDDIAVSIDGKAVFARRDKTYGGEGRIGVWIKADSMTYFDDLKVQSLR